MVYEWLIPSWDLLLSQYHSQKLAHAYLLNGVPGIGKKEFAQSFASYVLCDSKTEASKASCGKCKQCKLVEAGTHPDLKFISPEEGSSVLKVDAIRSMVEFFERSSMQAGKKIAVLEPAESLNVNAANALLKTLEEPSGESLIVLVSHNAGQLLPTIRSRCQVLDLPLPNEKQSKEWLYGQADDKQQDDIARTLELANLAPLKALAYLKTDAYFEYCSMLDELAACLKKQVLLTKVAERWADDIAIIRLQWVICWIESIIKVKLAELNLDEHHQGKMFKHLAEVTESAVLMDLHQFLLKQLRLLQGSSNPNRSLLFEEVLVKLSHLL